MAKYKISKKDKDLIKKTDIAFQTKGAYYHADLIDLGYECIEEDTIDEDYEKEKVTKPKNKDQRKLDQYINGMLPISNSLLTSFLNEVGAKNPNYPLLRKWFKSKNTLLSELILYGLERFPCNEDLLRSLGYFTLFENNFLTTLINKYIYACDKELNLKNFEILVDSFYFNVASHDFDVFIALEQKINSNLQKKEIVQKMKNSKMTNNIDDVRSITLN